jgi:NitT/TauT family transport system permease protein
MWTIRATLDRRLYLLIAGASFGLWLLVWWAVTALEWVDPLFLPGPGAVVRRFATWLRDVDLLKDAGISTFRW